MIRDVREQDAAAIADIYNRYVRETDITFETDPVTTDGMRQRILQITREGPYLVWEEAGVVTGYCYAHAWKTRPAYAHTLESTVYLHPLATGQGIGARLMNALIEACRHRGVHVLIACITGGNEASCRLHARLGFTEASHFHAVGRKFGRWIDVVDYEKMIGEESGSL